MTYLCLRKMGTTRGGNGSRKIIIKLPESMIEQIKDRATEKGNSFSAEVRETLWRSLSAEA
jgi:plasmid stability protein